jgi:hypothetical protein
LKATKHILENQNWSPKGRTRKRYQWSRNIVLTLVERGRSARSFKVNSGSQDVIWPIIAKNIRRESDLMTVKALC